MWPGNKPRSPIRTSGARIRLRRPELPPWEALAQSTADQYVRDGPQSLAAIREILRDEGGKLGSGYSPQQDVRTAILTYLRLSMGLPRASGVAATSPAQRARWVRASARLANKVAAALVNAQITASEARILTRLAASEARDSRAQTDALLWVSASLAVGTLSLALTALSCLKECHQRRNAGRALREEAKRSARRRSDSSHPSDLPDLTRAIRSFRHQAERTEQRAARPYLGSPRGQRAPVGNL